MYQSKMFIPTLKEDPKEAQIFSHNYLIRAGYIKKNAAGLYTYLPLAKRSIRKIEEVIRCEIEKMGAAELVMPLMQPTELWEESGRLSNYGPELFRIRDRHNREFAMSPTAEEICIDTVRNYLNSYKKFPLNVYQMNTKFRDERRPRFGLLRSREFIMFDGYSFHTDAESLSETYSEYHDAYIRILDRLGLDYKIVTADNGLMGGSKSQEFMAISEVGEDTIAFEENSNIAFNVETAPIKNNYQKQQSTSELEKHEIDGIDSIDSLVEKLNISADQAIKAQTYRIDGELVVAFCNAKREIEETKLVKVMSGSEIEPASNSFLETNGIKKDWISPFNVDSVKVVFDNELKAMSNFVCLADEENNYYSGIDFERDVNVDETSDICQIQEGDILREGGNPVSLAKGIEIGHIFELGDRYTRSMGMTYLDKNQKQETPIMGCYGIGVSRLLAAYVEQKNKDGVVKFEEVIAPFDYHLVVLDYHKNEEQAKFANDLAQKLEAKGKTVLIDDRNERVGSKLADCELIGCANQIVIGRDFAEGLVEVKDGKNTVKTKVEELYA